MGDVKSTGGGPTSQHSQLSTVSHSVCYSYMFSDRLVPRPSYCPVFDRLQYAKTEGDDQSVL